MSDQGDRFPGFVDFPDSKRLVGQLTTGGYKIGAMFARALPGPLAAGLALPAAMTANATNRDRRMMIERHLRRVDPTLGGIRLRRAVHEAFDYYARYWIESFRLPSLSKRAVSAPFVEDGYRYVLDALAAGQGAIIALPHLGGWEWAGRWIADRGHPITVIVERLEPPELFEWFVDLRSKLGMTVVPLGPDAGTAVIRALNANHVVCLLSDRDIQGGGPDVEFFGERTTLPGGAATLALRTGAPILPVGVYFTDRIDGHLGYVRPPVPVHREAKRLRDDVQRITQLVAGELEVLIRRAPSQWHMFQPNWPSDPGYLRRDSTRTAPVPKN